jgi:hypothetical protein
MAPPTVWILPYIEQQNAFQLIYAAQTPAAFDSSKNKTSMKIYQCPSDATIKTGTNSVSLGSLCSYAANGQVFGSIVTTSGSPAVTWHNWKGGTVIPRNVPDGLSNTIFWTEKLTYCVKGGSRWAANGGGSWMPVVGTKESALSPNIAP